MTTFLLVIVLGVLGLPDPTRGYLLDYVDCLEPQQVTRIDATSACAPVGLPEGDEERVTLVQRIEVRRTQGFRCTVKESRFRYFCGAFSHLKVAKIPEISHDIPVSPTWCRLMSTQRTFTPPGTTQTFPIKIDQNTYIAVALAGEITAMSDKIACKGQPFRTEAGIQDDLLVVSEYQVLVETEDFSTMNELIESTTDHITLPCKTAEAGCETGSGTYVWQPPTGCTMERIQEFRAKRTMGSYLVDDDKNILVNVTGITIAPAECGNVRLRSTAYRELYIADGQDAANWPTLSPGDFKIDIAERVREDYLVYHLERRMQSLQTQLQNSVCRQSTMTQDGEPQLLPNGKHALRRGDLIYVMDCSKKRGAILELPSCYEQIPLAESIWVNPVTRLRTSHSTQVPCQSKFPITIRVDTNTWVSITPALIPVPAPMKVHVDEVPPSTHKDMAKGGAYTRAEAEAWSLLLEFPKFHSALLKGVSIGSCVSSGICPAGNTEQGLTRYSLDSLTTPLETWNIWTRIDNAIRQYGDYAAALVLLIVVVKTIVNLTVLLAAWLKEGPAAVLAILLTVCCGTHQNLEKIRKRKQRRNRETVELEAAETEPLRYGASRPDNFK